MDNAKGKLEPRRNYLSALYKIWDGMIGRCHCATNAQYKYYGARGIGVYPSWRESFEEFQSHVENLPFFGEESRSLDRIDNDSGYEPGNVRWATRHEQMRNTRRTRLITLDGRTQCLKDWCEELGRDDASVYRRIKSGLSAEEALTDPLYRTGLAHPKCRAITRDGRTLSLRGWAREFGIRPTTVCERLKKGWTMDQALTTPVVSRSGNKRKEGKSG